MVQVGAGDVGEVRAVLVNSEMRLGASGYEDADGDARSHERRVKLLFCAESPAELDAWRGRCRRW